MALVRDHLAKAHKAGKPRPSQNATEDELKDQGVPRQYLRAAYSEICKEQDQGAPNCAKKLNGVAFGALWRTRTAQVDVMNGSSLCNKE